MIGVLMVLMMLNWLVLAGTWIWILVLASKEGALQVILCLFVPFYGLYYLISRWSDLQPAAPIYLGSVGLQILLAIGTIAIGASDASQAIADAGSNSPAPTAGRDQDPTPQPEATPAAEAADAATPSEPTPETPAEATPAEATTPEPTPEAPTTVTTTEPSTTETTTTQEPEKPEQPETKPEPKFPAGLQGDAQRAFHEGRVQDGNNFLRVALLTSDDKALWDNVRWCSALERPVIGLRWGIGLQLAEQPPVITPRSGEGQGGGLNVQAAGGAQGQDGQAQPAAEGQEGAQANEELAELRKYTGEIGPKVLEKLPKSSLDRLLGPLGEGVNAPKNVDFVGTGVDAKAVASLAQQKGVDELLLAVVSFKVYGVNRTVDANLTLRLIDVATDKKVWASKTLSSNQAKAEMAKGKDPTAEVVKSLSDYLDKNFVLKDKPDLDNLKIRQRADTISKEQQGNPLAALVEVRYYQLKGSLTQQQAEMCYRQLVGPENVEAMSTGTPEQRRRVLERYMPRSAG